jgi:hypothetical protein
VESCGTPPKPLSDGCGQTNQVGVGVMPLSQRHAYCHCDADCFAGCQRLAAAVCCHTCQVTIGAGYRNTSCPYTQTEQTRGMAAKHTSATGRFHDSSGLRSSRSCRMQHNFSQEILQRNRDQTNQLGKLVCVVRFHISQQTPQPCHLCFHHVMRKRYGKPKPVILPHREGQRIQSG